MNRKWWKTWNETHFWDGVVKVWLLSWLLSLTLGSFTSGELVTTPWKGPEVRWQEKEAGQEAPRVTWTRKSPSARLLEETDLWGLVCPQATAVSLPTHSQIMSVVLSWAGVSLLHTQEQVTEPPKLGILGCNSCWDEANTNKHVRFLL